MTTNTKCPIGALIGQLIQAMSSPVTLSARLADELEALRSPEAKTLGLAMGCTPEEMQTQIDRQHKPWGGPVRYLNTVHGNSAVSLRINI